MFVSPFQTTAATSDSDNSFDVIFVSDMFVEDYVGGAELTTQALIDGSIFHVLRVRSREVTHEFIKKNRTKFWVFGNYAQLCDATLSQILRQKLRYVIVEYDFKYCQLRSPEKHRVVASKECECERSQHGKLVFEFMKSSRFVFWMSEKQKFMQERACPELAHVGNIVLSSVFDARTLSTIAALRDHCKQKSDTWLVLGSDSWVKGYEAAKEWCVSHDVPYEVVWNVPYGTLLDKLSTSKGLVFLPNGSDTCPRLVIEAKLLGCELILNDNVLHRDESWFDQDVKCVESYLIARQKIFWERVKHAMDTPKISGYCTTRNCVEQSYPFEMSIQSLLTFCDEVCVVDDSDDGTHEKLQTLSERVKVKQVRRDWSDPCYPLFDGIQKAEARKMCSGDFCVQLDVDEVIHSDDAPKYVELCKNFPIHVDVVSLPVIEYWSSTDKVRIDVTPWKWRVSRNDPDITHGVPAQQRVTDVRGVTIAARCSDGCDVIRESTGESVKHMCFYDKNVDVMRQAALQGHDTARFEYERWFNETIERWPSVFHLSWLDIPRKIRLYRDYWTAHWAILAGTKYIDTAENNMMFDVPWYQVTDKMIEARAKELEQIGGWIWHRKWDGTKTPWIRVKRSLDV